MSDVSGSDVASAVSQLAAFYREPSRFRPYYIHGDEPLPEGHVVLKIALGRLAPGWAREHSALGREELIAAARAFVRQVCLWERATHYQLLCLAERARPEAIKENYRLLMALIHPDRQEADAHEWPTNCAQRVNEAYAVLSGESSREAYDDMLRRAHASAPFEHAAAVVSGKPHKARGGNGRRFAIVAAVLLAVFGAQAWWMSDTPQHYSLLQRAAALSSAEGWRNELPRFMGMPAVAFDPIELFKPAPTPTTLRSASASVQVANVVEPPAGSLPEALLARPPGALLQPEAPPPTVLAQANPIRSRNAVPSSAPAPVPASAPVAPVPAPAPAPAVSTEGPTSDDIEILVARIVSAYETGNADDLMALFDTEQLGMWKGLRVRNTYSDFFRSTRARRLRMERLSWQTTPTTAKVIGIATVAAEYADSGNRVERKVDVEIDIALREGQVRIDRLMLFPDGK